MNSAIDLSVVIATIGRDTLWPLLDDIEKDLRGLNFEILVVLDNPVIQPPGNSGTLYPNAIFLQLPKNIGAAAAYQLGIENASGKYLRIFSDDDTWKFGSTLELLELASDNHIIIGNVLFRDELGFSMRTPPKNLNQIGILSSMYGTVIPWKRNPNYLSLTSMLFPKEVSAIQIDPNFSTKEDIAWLEELWNHGFIFVNTNITAVEVNVSLQRTIFRNTLEQESRFLEILSRNHKELASRYLFQHSGRAAAALGSPRYFFRLLKIARNLRILPNALDFGIFIILYSESCLNFISSKFVSLFNRK
jgi:glycosyltransferase involved in cell wall biosynthesis